MRDRKLSVVVPIYNVSQYLEKCIQSICSQTYSNLEIILVDDGSTDGSSDICNWFAGIDKRIKVIHKENSGLINTKYIGVKNASSDYITFVDGDDWIDKNMYASLMKEIERYDALDLITSGCVRYYSDDNFQNSIDEHINPGLYKRDGIKKFIIPIMLWEREGDTWALDPSTCTKIYKKTLLLQVLERIKNYKFYYGEDTAITYSYVLLAETIYCTHKIFYFHRQREKGKIAPYIQGSQYFEYLFELYKYLLDTFQESIVADKEQLIKQLDLFYVKAVENRRLKYGLSRNNKCYLFPFNEVEKNAQIIIYGAGNVGQSYYKQATETAYCNIVMWVDKAYEKLGFPVDNPENIRKRKFDYIIIAIASEQVRLVTKERLKKMGIEEEKIVDSFIKI